MKAGMRLRIAVVLALAARACASEPYVKEAAWAQTMVASRAALAARPLPARERAGAAAAVWFRVKDDFPMEGLGDAGRGRRVSTVV